MTHSDTQDRLQGTSTADAFEWLLHSGIQAPARNLNTDGGVYAWYDLRKDAYPFVYGEITGYAINAYLHYYKLSGKAAALQAAENAAACLLRNRDPRSFLFLNRIVPEKQSSEYFQDWVFTFDQWMIISGLVNLSMVLEKALYLQEALKAADFLLEKTVLDDGSFYPCFDLEESKPVRTDDKWSRQPGGFHAKALIALCDISRAVAMPKYDAAAKRLVSWTLANQTPEGRYITQAGEASTHLHPHIYTLEGLLYFALRSKDSAATEAVVKGYQWLQNGISSEGALSSFYKGGQFSPFVRADIIAQAIRIGALLRDHGMISGGNEPLTLLRNKLSNFQVCSGPQKGGFFYGQEQDGTIHFHVNAWTTMFAVQALWLSDSDIKPDPWDMVFFV